MTPSYEEGDFVVVSRQAFDDADGGRKTPDRGDVVLMRNEIYGLTGEDGQMIKRVAAVGGDRVLITGGKVYVNNRELSEERYVLAEGIGGEMEEVRVRPGHVFVLGDNRAESTDSRSVTVGQVKVEDLLGKVIYKW